MHIPDGYLSPSTCGALFAAVAPFWYAAERSLRRGIGEARIPHIALMSSFSFIVMMFNIPMAGGTTGHATGAALAGIVLGPGAALLALTTTVVIQAVFFGDGGVLAIGANCFNLAIVMPATGALVYRLLAGSGIRSRTAAAAIAGYVAANAGALCVAVEIGLQPLLFRSPSGQPLYCPFPLALTVPGMMAGHLTVFGLVEALITGGVVNYALRHEPGLLVTIRNREHGRLRARAWLLIALFAAAVPLGLLSTGTAWGEWDEYARVIWPSVFGGYGRTAIRYMLSAFGGAVICAAIVSVFAFRHRRRRSIGSSIQRLAEMSDTPGSRPDLNPRLILLVGLSGIVLLNLFQTFGSLLAAAILPAAAMLLPGFRRSTFLKRIAASLPIVLLLFAAPALFVVPGDAILTIPLSPSDASVTISRAGLDAAGRLLLRAMGSIGYATAVVVVCGTASALGALRGLMLPASFVTALGMSFRYAAIVGRSLVEVETAYASRSPAAAPGIREGARRIGVALRRSVELSSHVAMAMTARGHLGASPPRTFGRLTAADLRFLALAAAVLAIPVLMEVR
ncbi:MAG: cobalt transporter CbiM [Acidobacteria bacterium]|nr:cobalt transporter CbiM [Acidobacteriota bacterium]